MPTTWTLSPELGPRNKNHCLYAFTCNLKTSKAFLRISRKIPLLLGNWFEKVRCKKPCLPSPPHFLEAVSWLQNNEAQILLCFAERLGKAEAIHTSNLHRFNKAWTEWQQWQCGSLMVMSHSESFWWLKVAGILQDLALIGRSRNTQMFSAWRVTPSFRTIMLGQIPATILGRCHFVSGMRHAGHLKDLRKKGSTSGTILPKKHCCITRFVLQLEKPRWSFS